MHRKLTQYLTSLPRVSRRRSKARTTAPEALEQRALLSGYGAEQLTNLFAEDTGFPSNPADFVEVNGTTYFRAQTPQHGTELWKTDGTEAGTQLVRDLRPGTRSGLPLDLTPFGNRLVFTIDRGFGRELWSTDGTSSGTRSLMFNGIRTNVAHLNVAGGKLYFTAEHNTFGRELWYLTSPTSSPTLSGNLSSGAIDTDFQGFAEKDGFLYFAANGNLHWANANTITTVDTDGFTRAYDMINFDGTLFIDAEGGSGKGLFKSDGTDSGTVLVRDIRGSFNSHTNLSGMMPAPNNNGIMFYTGTPATGSEPWFSDGTTGGTIVLDINPGSTGSFPFWDPKSPANLSGYTYFYANNGTAGGELYRSDGTVAGTTLMADSTPGGGGGMSGTAGVTGGKVFFSGGRFSANSGIWVSDGTNVGTVPFITGTTFVDARAAAGRVFFGGDDGSGTARELWSTTGTVAGTTLVKDIARSINSSAPTTFESFENEVLFAAAGPGGRELWAANGSVRQVSDIHPTGSSFPSSLTDGPGSVFFRANDGSAGAELWKSDGTSVGTVLVKDINPGAAGSNPQELVEANGSLFFTAETANEGGELWISDGTTGGTNLVADIIPGTEGSYPFEITEFQGNVVFLAYTDATGTELWLSDGTAGGTVQLSDLNGADDGGYEILNVFNGHVYFSAEDANGNIQLWRSDGTAAGTELFLDVEVGGRDSFVALDDLFLFSANDHTWASDGTVQGTIPVLDTEFSRPVVKDGVAYFGSWPNSGPNGMFRSDGTIYGSHHLFRMDSGDRPDNLTVVGDEIAFIARDIFGTDQVWTFDGNRSSLSQVTDTQWGGQAPNELGVADTSIYFSAFNPDTGVELHHVEYSAGPGIVVEESSGRTVVDTLRGSDDFRVSLDVAPTNDVVIDLSLQFADGTQLSESSLTFTSGNWDQPQTVWVTGPGSQTLSDEGDARNPITLSINDAASDDAYDLVPDLTVPVDVRVLPGTSFYPASTTTNNAVTFPFLVNDTPAGQVQLQSIDNPASGTVVTNNDGTLTYTPNTGFTGDDTFAYGVRLARSQASPISEIQARFGNAVDVYDDLAIVGASEQDSSGVGAGAAHVLKRVGGDWIQVQTLGGSTTTAADLFGHRVAFDGQTMVVSAPRDDVSATNTGSVFVFERDAAGVWQETAHLLDPNRKAADGFGSDVAVDGDTIVVGGRLDDGRGTNSGSAFVFRRNPNTGDWNYVRRIKPSDAAAFQQFGAAVSVNGDVIAVGAYKDDDGGPDAGEVYLFERNQGGSNSWGQVASLQAPTPEAGNWFGFDVSISGDQLLIGAPLDDVQSKTDAGSAWLFHDDETLGWVFNDMLTETRAANGNRVFSGGTGDQFGTAVDLSDNVAIVGAPFDDGQGRNSGSAFVFTASGTNWSPDPILDKFKSATPTKYDEFGSAVALGTTTDDFFTLIGAPKTDAPGVMNAGSVHAEYRRVASGTIRVTVSGETLRARDGEAAFSADGHLTSADIAFARDQAIDAWEQAGVTGSERQRLYDTAVSVFDLPGDALGLTTPHGIVLDTNAAGFGWFVDSSPHMCGGPVERMDLLTVLAHELGHVLNHEHSDHNDVMSGSLAVGERRLPMPATHLDHVFSDLPDLDPAN